MIRVICKIIAITSLMALVAPSCLYFSDRMSLDAVKWVMIAATSVWFAAASVWMWNSDSKA